MIKKVLLPVEGSFKKVIENFLWVNQPKKVLKQEVTFLSDGCEEL